MNDLELPKMKEETKEVKEVKSLTFKELIKTIFTFLTHSDFIDIIVFIFQLLVLALVIIVFKFPVELVIDLGPKIFGLLGSNNLVGILVTFWTLIFNIIYTIVGIYAYIKICEIRFVNLNDKK